MQLYDQTGIGKLFEDETHLTAIASEYGTKTVVMRYGSALFRLFWEMITVLDQTLDHKIEGIEFIIVQYQLINTGHFRQLVPNFLGFSSPHLVKSVVKGKNIGQKSKVRSDVG